MNDGLPNSIVDTARVDLKNPAAQILAAAAETDCSEYISQLEQVYELSETLSDDRQNCRKCGSCCNQTTRHLEVFAIEIAYMFKSTKIDDVPIIEWGSSVCPARSKLKRCQLYKSRPLGCRLFVPWTEWSESSGCASYPHNQETLNKVNYLLNTTGQLNNDFIRKTGLFRNFSFDFLSHWSVLQWFFYLETA